jgi:uncharacterized membrane protein
MSSANEPARRVAHGGFWRAASLVSGVVAYQFLAHLSLARPQFAQFAGLFASLPPLLLGIWLLRRSALAPRIAGAAVAVAAVVVASTETVTPAFCYLVVQISVYVAVFWLFAGTLRPGRQPLVTRLARGVHGPLPLEIERYTRRVTWYWSGVLAFMAGLSAALFALASASAWSLFANVLNAPLLVLAFVAEYAWRVLRYPHFSHASMAASLGAFRRIARRGKAVLHD